MLQGRMEQNFFFVILGLSKCVAAYHRTTKDSPIYRLIFTLLTDIDLSANKMAFTNISDRLNAVLVISNSNIGKIITSVFQLFVSLAQKGNNKKTSALVLAQVFPTGASLRTTSSLILKKVVVDNCSGK